MPKETPFEPRNLVIIMPDLIEIRSLSDPALEVYARLTESQLRSPRYGGESLFIAESPKVISCALEAGYAPVSLLMDRRHIDGKGADLIARCGDVPVYTADRAVLEALTGFALTRGILCAMVRRPLPSPETLLGSSGRIAVLEDIVDPTNVGAVFRSAAALGMDAVLVTPSCCDPLHRRAVRVSMGTVFQIPWARIGENASQWPKKGMETLHGAGFTVAALALSEDSISLEDPALRKTQKLAVVLGTEGDGLKRETVAGADLVVRIPMAHGVDSLNVAAASAVAFWQLRNMENVNKEEIM